MGLDIYIHKVKNPSLTLRESNDWESVRKLDNEQSRTLLEKIYDGAIKALKAASRDNYENVYMRHIKKICKFSNYPQFDFNELGVSYDYETGTFHYKPTSVEEFERVREKILTRHYSPYVGYFRKVNFLYHYFQPSLVDETAWITRDEIEDIIDRCQQVLADHNLAEELLPTQSGFFFGGTDYGKWYFYDVKDCLRQFKKLQKGLKEDEFLYVVMSW